MASHWKRVILLGVFLFALAATATPSITLQASPPSLSASGWVSVHFSGVPASEFTRDAGEYICTQDSYCKTVANLSVWIGVFPAGADLAPIGPQSWSTANPPWLASSPIKWKPIQAPQQGAAGAAGAGFVDFFMETQRFPVQFTLFGNGTQYPVALATSSNNLTFTTAAAPQHVHLALAAVRPSSSSSASSSSSSSPSSSPSSSSSATPTTALRVSWAARDLTADAQVRLSLTPGGPYTERTPVAATPSTYGVDDLCGPPATTHGWNRPQPWFYSAVVDQLVPGRPYFYVVGSETAGGFSREFSFAGPAAASADATLRITALADMGETYVDQAQYHWMEPFAVNTTNYAVHAWPGPPGTVPLSMNPAPDADGHVAVGKSGKEGPPSGHTMAHLAAAAAASAAAARRRVLREGSASSSTSTLTSTSTPTPTSISNSTPPPHHPPPPAAVATTATATATTAATAADVVLHIGDLAYATGYESEWDRFMAQIEPIASQVPYMTGQGNHERDYPGSGSAIGGADSGGECGVPTQSRFKMPTPSGRQDQGWYSWEQGPATFVMMDTEMAAYRQTAQYRFLEATLAAVDRSRTPWVIFMGHRPMYSSSDNATGLDVNNGPWWPEVEELLVAHEVDLCLWGHVHNAEVTCPLYRGKCVDDDKRSRGGAATNHGVTHAVIGNAGQSLSPFPATHPDWSRWRFAEFGYSTIEVEGGKALTMRFFADKNNSQVYEFSIDGRSRRTGE